MREFDKVAFYSLPDPTPLLVAYEQSGYSWTAIIDNEILFCAGICSTWNKCGMAWMLSSIFTEQYKIFLHRSIKNIIKDAIEGLNLHRLEIAVLENHVVSQQWVERLGFEYEGLMRNYDPQGNNYKRYALIKENKP